MLDSTRLLLVMCAERRTPLLEILESSKADVLTACSCREAGLLLQTCPPLQIVLTDFSLEDGGWWSVREEVVRAKLHAEVIVCLPRVDGGVIDLLESGASDVLVPPYNGERIQHLVEAAAARSYIRYQTKPS